MTVKKKLRNVSDFGDVDGGKKFSFDSLNRGKLKYRKKENNNINKNNNKQRGHIHQAEMSLATWRDDV